MEIKLKQRVIGIVVLGALAIIFIPLLFKGYNQANNQPNIIQQIPAPPPPPVAPNAAQTQQTQNTQALANNNPPGVVTSKNQVVSADNLANPTPATLTDTSDATAANTPMNNAATANVVTTTNTATTPAPKLTSAQVNKLNSLNKQLADNTNALPKTKSASKKATLAIAATNTKITPSNSSNQSGSYAIQVGTFSNAKNASNLVQQLHGHNLTAYAMQVTTSKGKMTRVLVGPLKDQATATKTVAELQKLNIKGNVVSPGNTQTSSIAKNSKKTGEVVVSSNANN